MSEISASPYASTRMDLSQKIKPAMNSSLSGDEMLENAVAMLKNGNCLSPDFDSSRLRQSASCDWDREPAVLELMNAMTAHLRLEMNKNQSLFGHQVEQQRREWRECLKNCLEMLESGRFSEKIGSYPERLVEEMTLRFGNLQKRMLSNLAVIPRGTAVQKNAILQSIESLGKSEEEKILTLGKNGEAKNVFAEMDEKSIADQMEKVLHILHRFVETPFSTEIFQRMIRIGGNGQHAVSVDRRIDQERPFLKFIERLRFLHPSNQRLAISKLRDVVRGYKKRLGYRYERRRKVAAALEKEVPFLSEKNQSRGYKLARELKREGFGGCC